MSKKKKKNNNDQISDAIIYLKLFLLLSFGQNPPMFRCVAMTLTCEPNMAATLQASRAKYKIYDLLIDWSFSGVW